MSKNASVATATGATVAGSDRSSGFGRAEMYLRHQRYLRLWFGTRRVAPRSRVLRPAQAQSRQIGTRGAARLDQITNPKFPKGLSQDVDMPRKVGFLHK
jgi:hypothetical protein